MEELRFERNLAKIFDEVLVTVDVVFNDPPERVPVSAIPSDFIKIIMVNGERICSVSRTKMPVLIGMNIELTLMTQVKSNEFKGRDFRTVWPLRKISFSQMVTRRNHRFEPNLWKVVYSRQKLSMVSKDGMSENE